MKPLQLIDVVMFWVARGFSFALLPYAAFAIWSIYSDYDSRLIAEYEHTPIFTCNDLLFSANCSVWGLTLLACTWCKPTLVSKGILGISAGFLTYLIVEIIAIQSPLHTAIALGMHITIWDFTLPAWLALTAFAMAWLAIMPNQFRIPRFIHSVNSV